MSRRSLCGMAIAMTSISMWSAAGAAHIIEEVEPNNFANQAQAISDFPGIGFYAIHGSILPGDVDFFAFEVTERSIFEAVVYSYPNLFPVPQARLELYDSTGTILGTAEAGQPLWAYLSDMTLLPGTYVLGLTGLGDTFFTGEHDEQFEYTMHLIPGPAVAPLLLLPCLRGRRRRP